ncbi:hypothetical protein [Streptomyces lateritius]|nr:hypothetical protein [Streptomyces lateritius]
MLLQQDELRSMDMRTGSPLKGDPAEGLHPSARTAAAERQVAAFS